ncbi:MAG: hypothetical protein KF715_19740 [Candidatus Didemnitutus sp.]|nr:hypothetical protein [Candidatus Didemnitutus sp.]
MRTELLWLVAAALTAGCIQTPISAPPLPPAPTVAPSGMREPERVRSYTLGAYVDPEDQTVRHDAHLIHRVEAASRWNLGPSEGQPMMGVERERLPEATPAIVPPPVKNRASLVREDALEPDSSGLIDLTGADRATEVNPFEIRGQKTAKELSLVVSGVIGGARPAAIVNGHSLEVGGVIDGLRVRTVEADAVLFEYGRWRLRVPVSPVGTRVRMTN